MPGVASTAAPVGLPPAQGAESLFGQIAPWLAVLVCVVIVGWVVIVFVRRSMRAEAEAQVGFTLEDLRRLHKSGEMTSEEFERAKAAMLAKRPSREELLAEQAARRRPPASRPPPSQTKEPPS